MTTRKLLTLAITFLFVITNVIIIPPFTETAHAANNFVTKIYVDKARYSPGETATISVNLYNSTGADWAGPLYLDITHLETSTYSTSKSVTIPAGTNTVETFTWTVPANDYRGYLVKVSTDSADYKTTAIDCSSNWSKYPRYGYIADFPSDETSTDSTNKINELIRDYHINAFQFYNWTWRYDKLIKRTDGVIDSTWTDLFGRTINWQTIQNQISAVHNNNAKAMAYVMSYAAREGYDAYNIQANGGMYSDKNHSSQLNVDFGNGTSLWLFNPANAGWQNYIINEYKDAINSAGFDGLQMDQLEQMNNVYDYYGRPLYLQDTFSDLVNETKSQLTANNSSKNFATFNVVDGTVNGWALNDVSKNANTDFDFSEIWWKSNNYNDMKDYIEQFRANNGGKPLVLAAYMNYNDNCGTRYEAESATLYNVTTNTNHTGYTGTGFVDGFTEAGDYVEFSFSTPEDGLYSFVFRYANDSGSTSTRNVYIDGVNVTTLNFKDLANWDTWAHDANYSYYLTAGNHTVRLKYDSDNTGAINLDSMTLGTFDDNSVRLANATFAACGASHIELGANKAHAQMLAHEYYPTTSKTMRSSLRNAMMEHYDFITAYENLLYDSDVINADGATQFLSITGENVSGSGESGKIWYIGRQKGDYQILHLINLTGENDTQWRNETGTPATKTNLAVKYYIGSDVTVSGVYAASPDVNQCTSQSLSYTTGSDSQGTYVSFTVPELRYWDMIYIKRTFNTPSSGIYEAENAVKTNVTVDTDHTGYSGTGFVDQFEEAGDKVSFTVKVDTEKDYTFKFRYANDTGYQATRALFVDGKFRGKVYFNDLANWDTWGLAEIGVHLKPGTHQIALVYGQYEAYSINLDYMKVENLEESARSLYANNWSDTVYIWKDTEVNKVTSLNGAGPSIYELRYYAGGSTDNYNTNHLKNYSTFLRNETDNLKYTDGSKFRSTGYFGSDGVLYNDYTTFNDVTLSPQITKAFAVVPNQKFMVVKYTVKNTAASTKTYKIMDMLHVNNITANNITASYNSENKTTTIDMSAAGQYYIAHGTLESTIDGYQVANDTISNTADATCSPWFTFDNDGTLKNNSSVTTPDISTAFMKSVTLSAGTSADIYFYLAIAGSSADLSDAVSTLRAQTGSYWMSQMNTDYKNWLNSGTRTNFSDPTLNTAYDRTLVALKQSIVPGQYTSGSTVYKFAAMPATTNPSAYSYKVWARDSAVSAMAMDASGHTAEADKYWYWLADRQIKVDEGGWKKPGTFWTCYWIWDNSPVSFVEPEYDSIGMFLVGAYRHYQKLSGSAQTTFLNNIWDAYRLSADFVANNGVASGFGPADCSIWEEQTEYNSFTQALYIAGMDAAQMMAKAKGLQDVADIYNGVASAMRTAVQRDSTASPYIGLWNSTDKHFNRAVSTDNTANTLHDSSSDVLISYGVVDAKSSRAKSHIDNMLSTLAHDTYGVSRYDGDGFYHRMSWDPGGDEALEDEASWPQMAMWVAMYEIQSGYDSYKANALRRLKWYTQRTGKGYMPQGEAVSNVTLKPAISTMVEPITGASYIMAALAYLGNFDMRILPPQFNVGAYKAITVSNSCSGDWDQWYNIPYYNDKIDDSAVSDSNYDISRVNVSNDADNLYIRIDTTGSDLPGYNETEKFAVNVYSEDFAGTAAKQSTAYYGSSLSRQMSYMVGRWSNSNDFVKHTTNGTNWSSSGNITSVIAPQWETASGRIEIVIPFSQLSSTGSVSDGSWANMDIVLVKETSPGTWAESDSISIHYKKTSSSDEWLKGNFD